MHAGFQVRQHRPWKIWVSMLLLAGLMGLAYVRKRARAGAPQEATLTAAEQARLDEILKE